MRRWVFSIFFALSACAEGGRVPRDASVSDDGVAPARFCSYISQNYDLAPQVIDLGPARGERLRFVIPEIPDLNQIAYANLIFLSRDSDNPQSEGMIVVNNGTMQLPANSSWSKRTVVNSLDISDFLISGINVIDFVPTRQDRNYFEISKVRIDILAQIHSCPRQLPLPVGD